MSLKWLLKGAAISIGLGALLFYLSQQKKKSVKFTRERFLRLLSQTQRERVSLLTSIAKCANRVYKKSGQVPQQYLMKILYSQIPILQQSQLIQNKIYRLFSTDQVQIRKIYLLYQNDPEVSQKIQEMENDLKQAYIGVVPDRRKILPEFMTSEKVLRIMGKIHIKYQEIALSQVKEAKRKGICLSYQDPEYQKLVERIEDLVDFEKVSLFREEDLEKYAQTPSSLVYQAIQVYSEIDQEFQKELGRMERENSRKIQLILRDELQGQQLDYYLI